jgi:hypothetical protein
MKSPFLSSLACAVTLASVSLLAPEAGAQSSGQEVAAGSTPLNCRCIVTVDPQFKPAVESADQPQKGSGFIAPNTVEGIVVRMDSEWLVLKDGSYENWIPKDKVLLLRVSR